MLRYLLLMWMFTTALSDAMIFYPPFPPPGQYHQPPPSQPIPPIPPSHIPQRPVYHQQSLLSLIQLYLNGMRTPQLIHVPQPPQVIALSENAAEGETGVTPQVAAQGGQNAPEGGALMEGQPAGHLANGAQLQNGGSLQHSVPFQQGAPMPHGSPLQHPALGAPPSQGSQLLHSISLLNGGPTPHGAQNHVVAQLPPGFQLPHGASLAGVPSGLPKSASELGNLGGLVVGSDTGGAQPTAPSLPQLGVLPTIPPPGFRRPTIYNLQNNVPNNPLPIAQIRTQFYERLCYQTQATVMPIIQGFIPGFQQSFFPADAADPPACSCIPFNDCESAVHRFINEKTKDECGSTLTGFACCCEEPPLIGK